MSRTLSGRSVSSLACPVGTSSSLPASLYASSHSPIRLAGRTTPILLERGLSLCALEALRGTSGGATMTTPTQWGGHGGAGCHPPSVLEAPASIMGPEFPGYRAPILRSPLALTPWRS
jgi:hypothetical protein